MCPHAGGVGLCEMVQHLQYWDFTSVSGTMENRLIEYVDQQHEHFVDPCVVENARYLAPKVSQIILRLINVIYALNKNILFYISRQSEIR